METVKIAQDIFHKNVGARTHCCPPSNLNSGICRLDFCYSLKSDLHILCPFLEQLLVVAYTLFQHIGIHSYL